MEQQELKDQTTSHINTAFDNFITAFDRFTAEQINIVPFEDSWTAGQVAEHIIKATGGLPDNKTQPAERPAHAKVHEIESVFLNFDIKMKSPDFIVPGNKVFNKEKMLERLNKTKLFHINKIRDTDLTELCLDFALPGMGHFTRYEWYRFIAAHCRRHTRQLQRIYRSLTQ
jgi:hypothetical protein